ncbi:4908_t:CDS:2, partial [Scutellospora calospora]
EYKWKKWRDRLTGSLSFESQISAGGTGSLLGCLMFKATGWTDWIETWNVDEMEKWRQTSKYIEEIHKQEGKYEMEEAVSGIGENIFPDGRNLFKEEQTEYDYIIRFVSRVYIMLFKDRTLLKCNWGEKTLRCSAILHNRSLKDDDRRCSGNKIDAIMSILDIGLKFSTLEVSGSSNNDVLL